MEDSHYCLKCGSTLVGLDNYINHRKLPCDSVTSSKMYDETLSCDVKIVMEEESKNPELEPEVKTVMVEADDFFSSLELQSSWKTSTNATNLNVSNKSSSGIVTRSKALLSYQDVPRIPEKLEVKTVKTRIPRKVKKAKKRRLLKSRKKTTKTTEAKKSALAKEKKEMQKKQTLNIAKVEENDRTSPVLEKAKDDDDWNLFNPMGLKKDVEERRVSEAPTLIRRYTPELFPMCPGLISDELQEDKDVGVDKFLEHEDYEDDDAYLNLEDEDDFNYAPPRSHTGGKWKPGSLTVRTSPVLWSGQTWDNLLEEDGRNSSAESPTELDRCKTAIPPLTGGKWKSYNPPSTHTGGKWKPSEAPQPVKKLQDVPPATHTGGKWHPGKRVTAEPPATHTGGKWKPQISPTQQIKTWKNDSDFVSTKWVTSKNSVDNKTLNVIASCQSTSGKCLKTAGGLIQYYCSPCNRRLASKKMYKKHVLSELHLKRVLQENELEFDSRSIKIFRGLFSVMNNKQRGLGKREIKKPEFFKDMQMNLSKMAPKEVKCDKVKRKRLPRRELIRCDICKAKLASHQLGKHLVSYYHSRRIRLNDPEQQKLVLDNIHAIVKQAPYQCGICKFYFNTHMLFKKHWTSDDHNWMEGRQGWKFWCVLCNFECETSRSMELHLDSNSHREVIMAVNKSIPIIIRQKQILNCKLCDKKFRYNFALIRHNRISHGLNETENLKVYPCLHCKYKSKTVKSLQRHIIRCHKESDKVPYFCSQCDEYFHTAEDAKNHRKSQSHRSQKKDATMMARSCPYCQKLLDDVETLKIHIGEEHSELRPKCAKCGSVFSLPQEISQHKKSCSFVQVEDNGRKPHQCRICAYSSSLKADVIYHEMLHEREEIALEKVSCPICRKSYRMFALKVHIRTHTGERPYECESCSRSFVRKSRLMVHIKLEHPTGGDQATKSGKGKSDSKIAHRAKCGDPRCKFSSVDAEDLEYHARVHIGRKQYQCPSCYYQAKTHTLLKRHNKIHLDERSYPCPHCAFRGRLASHLKRHLRLHTGAKPYKCPHCPYACNILENLRKHVLYTKIHPGKKLYECKLCDYATNGSVMFKQHLFQKHSEKFGTEMAVTAYVAGIYNAEEDIQTTINPVPVKQKAPPTPKTDRGTVLKKVAILTKKFEPIAPKPSNSDGKILTKNLGNSVQDKRKVLEMELEKLKNQAKKKPPLRSYPTPTILRDLKKAATTGEKHQRKESSAEERTRVGATKKERGSQLTVAINQMENQAEDPSPTYILYESGISFEDNEDHLAEQEFYLLENYND